MNYQVFLGFLNLAIALLVTKNLIPKLIVFGKKFNFIDKSDKRKKIKKNMVRIGGISIFIGFFISIIITFCVSNIIGVDEIFFDKINLLFFIGIIFFLLLVYSMIF